MHTFYYAAHKIIIINISLMLIIVTISLLTEIFQIISFKQKLRTLHLLALDLLPMSSHSSHVINTDSKNTEKLN